jgi:hypothetical protein
MTDMRVILPSTAVVAAAAPQLQREYDLFRAASHAARRLAYEKAARQTWLQLAASVPGTSKFRKAAHRAIADAARLSDFWELEARVAYAWFQRETGFDTSTIADAVARLVPCGLIEILALSGGRVPHHLRLVIPGVNQPAVHDLAQELLAAELRP